MAGFAVLLSLLITIERAFQCFGISISVKTRMLRVTAHSVLLKNSISEKENVNFGMSYFCDKINVF